MYEANLGDCISYKMCELNTYKRARSFGKVEGGEEDAERADAGRQIEKAGEDRQHAEERMGVQPPRQDRPPPGRRRISSAIGAPAARLGRDSAAGRWLSDRLRDRRRAASPSHARSRTRQASRRDGHAATIPAAASRHWRRGQDRSPGRADRPARADWDHAAAPRAPVPAGVQRAAPRVRRALPRARRAKAHRRGRGPRARRQGRETSRRTRRRVRRAAL